MNLSENKVMLLLNAQTVRPNQLSNQKHAEE
jgi:hypothetical protein